MTGLLRFGIFSLTVFTVFSAAAYAGPFGLERGMTKAQIIALVGKDAVARDVTAPTGGTTLLLSTVPKPYKEFQRYVLKVSPTDGLLSIIAIGSALDTSSDGEELRSHYTDLKSALEATYLKPTSDFDFLKSGSIWSEPSDFMMSLQKRDRTLSTFWTVKDGAKLKDGISLVSLEAKAASRTGGFLVLTYEFDGWEAYVNAVNAKEGSVL